jgi:hypothetical protein
MQTFKYVGRIPVVLLALGVIATTACEQIKSASPLSPSIAGPIAGVVITTPTPMVPASNIRIKDTEQPLTLAFKNPESNSQRPFTLTLQLALDSTFADLVFGQVGIQPSADGVTKFLMPNKLQGGRVYFWRIRADDGANSSDWSGPLAFEVLQPVVLGTPNPVSPISNERSSSETPTLRVRNGVSTGVYLPLKYNFQVSTNPSFNSMLANDWVAQDHEETRFRVPSSPGPDTVIYWRARVADDDGNQSQWSRTESYRTPLANTPPPGGGGSPLPPGNCASNSGPAIVQCIEAKYPDRTVAGVSEHQRRVNMEFLRDRIIEAGLCGGMDLGRNLKRGGPEISVDFLVWRSPNGDIGIDIGAAYDDTSIPLRLHWAESIFPFYQAYPKPNCG